jgi:hypothetical protein
VRRWGLLAGLIIAATWPAGASGEPVSFAHGTIDQQFTTPEPSSPTGSSFTARYHAAGDPNGDPPYMRRMTFYAPAGMQYDTSVPERCTASDAELALRGPAACPAASRIGEGTADGKAMNFEPTTLDVHVFNNAGEQVMVIGTPGIFTVSRGKFGPDGSITFESPTCYPSVNAAGCPVDNAAQLGSAVTMPAYVRDGRSYLTTPPDCPAAGHWESVVRFWWGDGSEDTVVLTHACVPPSGA